MTTVLGAVLVGGASTRMGTDKASLEVDGDVLARRVATALEAGGAERVVLVGNNRSAVDLTWLEGVADRWPGEGPLGGLVTALGYVEASGAEVAVVAGCDHPDLSPALVARLVAALDAAPPGAVAAVARTEDGRLQPLPSAWRSGAAPRAEALVRAGERRLVAALSVGLVVTVDAGSAELLDVDTPEELAAWRDRHRGNPEPPRRLPR